MHIADWRLGIKCRLQTWYEMQTETKIEYKMQIVREKCF